MKIKTKQITVTAIMLAICLVSQFFKNLSVYITGPIINAALILTVLYAGMACGIILSIITPVTSFFITGSPVMAAIPAMFPCIMIGNIILVVCVGLLRKKCGKATGFPVSIAIGAILKAVFMGIAIALIILPAFLPCSNAQDAAGITASVFSDTAYHRCYRRCICSHNCGCA